MAWYEDSAPRYQHHVTGEDLQQGQGQGHEGHGNDLEAGDLPFDVHDLPPEIRLKIDDIIRNNEDLEAQMDAIDALLFGAQTVRRTSDPDAEAESGIDTDYSGSITSSEYVAMTSSSSPYLSRDPPPVAPPSSVETASGFPQLDDVDDFIARMTVLPPPVEFDVGPEVATFDPAFLPPADVFPVCGLLPPLPEIDEEDPPPAWTFQLPPPFSDDSSADTLPVVLPPPVFDGQSLPPFQTESQTQQRSTLLQKVSTNYPPIAPKPPKTPTAGPEFRPNFQTSQQPESPSVSCTFQTAAMTSSKSVVPFPASTTSSATMSLNGNGWSKAPTSSVSAYVTSTTSSVLPASTAAVSCPPVAPKPAVRPSVVVSAAPAAASNETSSPSTLAPSASCPTLEEEPSTAATVIAVDSPRIIRRRFSGNTDTLQPEKLTRSSKLKTFFKFGRLSGFDHELDKPSKTKKHSIGVTSPTSPLSPSPPAVTPPALSNGTVAGSSATMPRPHGKPTAPTWSKVAQEESATARQKAKKQKKSKSIEKQDTKAAAKEPKESKQKHPLLATHLGISATLPRLPSSAPQRPAIVSVDGSRLSVPDKAPQLRRRLSDECLKPVTFTTADDDDEDERNGNVDEEDAGSETCESSSDEGEGGPAGRRRGTKSGQPFRDQNGRLMFANSDGTLTKAHSMMCLSNIGRGSADADAATSKKGQKSKTVDEPSLSRSSHFPAGVLTGSNASGNGGAEEKSASKPSPTASSISGGTLKGRYKKNVVGLPIPAADRSPRVQKQQRPAAPVRTTPLTTSTSAKTQNGLPDGADSTDQEIELLRRCDYLSPASGSTSSSARPSPAVMTDKLLRRSLAADDLPPPAVPLLLPADGGELNIDLRAEPGGGNGTNFSASSFGNFGTFRGNMKPIRWSEDSTCTAASSVVAASRIAAVVGTRPASDGGATRSANSGRPESLPTYMVVQAPTSAQPSVTVPDIRNGVNNSPKMMTSVAGNVKHPANGDGAKVRPQTQPRKASASAVNSASAVTNNVYVVPPTSSTSTAVPVLTTSTTTSRAAVPLTLPRPSLINSPAIPATSSSPIAVAQKPTATSTAPASTTSGLLSVAEFKTASFSAAAAAVEVQNNRFSTCSAVIDDVFIPEPVFDYVTEADQLPEPLLDDILLPAPDGYAFDLPPPVCEFDDDVTFPNELNWQDDVPEDEPHNDELIATKAYVTTTDPCLEAEYDIDVLTSDLQLHVNTSLNGGAVPLLTSEDQTVARDTVDSLSLAVRQFVTDSKNFVSAAAAVDVVQFGTCVEAAMHTLACIAACCRRLLAVRSPGDDGVSGVVSGVLDTARTFRMTVESGRLTGFCRTDAEIEAAKNEVLEQAGELATSLSRLVQAVRMLAQQQ